MVTQQMVAEVDMVKASDQSNSKERCRLGDEERLGIRALERGRR